MAGTVSIPGWAPLVDGATRPSSAIIAEFLRAAAQGQAHEDAVSIHSLFFSVENRLGILFPFVSSMQEKVFGELADTARSDLRDCLEWLTEIGDLIDVGGGYYYPSPGRIVSFGGSVYAIISGAPSEELGLPQNEMIGRVTNKEPNHPLISQNFEDWARIPADLQGWAKHFISQPLRPLVTDASEWEMLRVSLDDVSFEKPGEQDWGKRRIYRAKRESRSGYDRYVAVLEPGESGGARCLEARLVYFHDCSRIIQAKRRIMGLPSMQLRSTIFNSTQIRVTTNVYQLPELIMLLTLFSTHREFIDERLHQFTIPRSQQANLAVGLRKLGMELIPNG